MITGAIIFGVGVLVGLLAPVGVAKLRSMIEKA
jgi:LPS O-antigen subunit length determinant protein (WzzB/FepE family)